MIWLTCVLLLCTAGLQWQSENRQLAATTFVMVVSLALMSVWSWRKGAKREREMRLPRRL